MTEDGYQIYSKKYDRLVRSEELASVIGEIPAKFRASYDEACSALEHGLAGWRASLDLACIDAGRRIADALPRTERESTAICLLIDHSGSMSGQRILLATATAMGVTDWLVSLGIKLEVLGFTTTSWRGGRPRRNWRWFKKRNPGRLCELLHIVYRKADEPSPGMSWSVRNMLRGDLLKENVDGEAVLWAAERLRQINARRKILVVLSDGAPVDDSTLHSNGAKYLAKHLKGVVSDIEKSGMIEIAAIDICGNSAREFYSRVRNVDAVSDLGIATVELIEGLLLDHTGSTD